VKPHYNFFFTMLKAFDDYKKEYDIKSEPMTPMFFDYMLERYGIEVLLDGASGYIRAAYNIKDVAKHSLFILKYGDMLGENND